MENKRYVDRLLSVFDLSDCDASELNEGCSARVMLLYDRNDDEQNFTVLKNGMTTRDHERITAWVKENVHLLTTHFGISHIKSAPNNSIVPA